MVLPKKKKKFILSSLASRLVKDTKQPKCPSLSLKVVLGKKNIMEINIIGPRRLGHMLSDLLMFKNSMKSKDIRIIK